MDASHIVVAGLTGISIALLVWVEIRSRRNTAAQQNNSTPLVQEEVRPAPTKKNRRR